MMRRITTILFDLDDTLMAEMAPEEASFRAAAEEARARAGVESNRLVAAVQARAEALWRAGPCHAYAESIGFASWEGLWARYDWPSPEMRRMKAWAADYPLTAWTQGLADAGAEDAVLARDLLAAYRAERARRHEAFPESAPLLTTLRREFRLGLLTNGCPDVQHRKLDGSGLREFFAAVVVTGEVGIGKPDPRPFEVILDRLGAAKEAAVMVGNSLTSDIQGARNAGVRSVWLDLDDARLAEAGPAPIRPDARIKRLSDLPGVLDRL